MIQTLKTKSQYKSKLGFSVLLYLIFKTISYVKVDNRKLMSSRMVIDTTSLSALASSLQPSVLHSSYASVVSRPLEHEIVHHVWH